jgi:hypothetical protein
MFKNEKKFTIYASLSQMYIITGEFSHSAKLGVKIAVTRLTVDTPP